MTLSPVLRLLRPRQWLKNLAAFAGIVFGGRLLEPQAVALDTAVVLTFLLASAATYAFNDVCDAERDRRHPRKRSRPVAAGEVSVATALTLAVLLASLSLLIAALISGKALLCLALFLAINFLYSRSLKHVFLVDITCVAIGYVLRVLASIYVLDDVPTTWITLCTFFVALFLASTKRAAERLGAEVPVANARPVLREYDGPFLDLLLNSSATMAVISYAMFTATSGKNPTLVVTVPLVYFGIMHYRSLVQGSEAGEEPETVLLTDRALRLTILLWLASFIAIFYGKIQLFR